MVSISDAANYELWSVCSADSNYPFHLLGGSGQRYADPVIIVIFSCTTVKSLGPKLLSGRIFVPLRINKHVLGTSDSSFVIFFLINQGFLYERILKSLRKFVTTAEAALLLGLLVLLSCSWTLITAAILPLLTILVKGKDGNCQKIECLG